MLEPILDHVPNRVCFVEDLQFQLFEVTLDQTPWISSILGYLGWLQSIIRPYMKKRKRNIPEAEAVVDSDIWTLSWSFRISELVFYYNVILMSRKLLRNSCNVILTFNISDNFLPMFRQFIFIVQMNLNQFLNFIFYENFLSDRFLKYLYLFFFDSQISFKPLILILKWLIYLNQSWQFYFKFK